MYLSAECQLALHRVPDMKLASWPIVAVVAVLAISTGSASAQGRADPFGGQPPPVETAMVGNSGGGGLSPDGGTGSPSVEYTGSISSSSGNSGSTSSNQPAPARLTITTEQSDALTARQQAQALPLETILGTVRNVTTGTVINAELTKVQGFLLYEVRVLETDGMVKQFWYYAKSGLPVRTD